MERLCQPLNKMPGIGFENIEGKLAAHDRHQLELKLGYSLDPSKRENNYKVDLFFFIPRSLGINPRTYNKDYFYSDIQSYLRFRTPRFSFAEILDENNQKSPLTRIKKLLDLKAEIKLFACTLRVAMRNSIEHIRRRLRKNETGELKDMVVNLCKGTVECLAHFRQMRGALESNIDFLNADEFLGIVTDEFLNTLHNMVLNSNLTPELSKELCGIISPVILQEFNYRTAHGYVTYCKESENELFLYRKGILKKSITSPLFLETHTQEGLFYLKDFLFAGAAGVAMMVFVMVSLWAGKKWSATSIPFAFALVFGYIIKDRIKDWFKFIFSHQMTKYLSDYKTVIRDPESEDDIGICRHAFSFISEAKVPKDVLNLRKGHIKPGDFWLAENVIKYEKEVRLKPGPILRAHSRLGDVTDIIRFNIRRFLERMDEPYDIHKAFDPQTGAMAEFKCARVYHVSLVIKIGGSLRRIRLVMNKNGIKRIEEIHHG